MSHLLLFDPYAGGHHAEHVRHVLRGWHERYGGSDHRVTVAVAPELLSKHPDLLTLGEEMGPNVRFVEIRDAEGLGEGLLTTGLWHRRALERLIVEHRPSHTFLLYLDHAQLALGLGLRFPFPVSISGLLFRPSFHYGRFDPNPPPFRERATRFRKRLVLQAAMRNPHLGAVFTLDPSAVPDLARLSTSTRVVALPDPIDPAGLRGTGERSVVRAAYGVEEGRVLGLLFGYLDERKGVFALLEALRLLPE